MLAGEAREVGREDALDERRRGRARRPRRSRCPVAQARAAPQVAPAEAPLAARDCAANPPARNFCAVSAKLRPSSSTSPFIAIIVAASIDPASFASGAGSTPRAHQHDGVVLREEAEIVGSSTVRPSRPSLASVE